MWEMWTAEQEETHRKVVYQTENACAEITKNAEKRKQTKNVEIMVLVSNNNQQVSLRRKRLKREETWSLHGENKVSPEVHILLFSQSVTMSCYTTNWNEGG